jgi:hypothetical protein
MAMEACWNVSPGGACSSRLVARCFQTSRMDTRTMRRRSLLTAFLLGFVVLSVPIFLLLDRSPAVETVIHLEPNVVHPGQSVEVVWTVKTLRENWVGENCCGRVYRMMFDSQKRVFAFESTLSVTHAPVGETRTYHIDWTIPMGMLPGPATLRRNVDRWCNPLQQWLWPMQEVHEAAFTVLP